MRLYTIQPVEVLDIINRDGHFRCDTKLSKCYDDFKDAYLWLVEQMDKKIERVDNARLPVWAWYIYDWKNSMETYDFSDVKEDSVCLELEIDERKVLLSDFDAWHFVLNNWWFDDSYSEEEWNKNQEYFDKLSAEEQKVLKEKSWNGIFNISKFENEWFTRGRYVQATFWEIKKDMIKNITYIKNSL